MKIFAAFCKTVKTAQSALPVERGFSHTPPLREAKSRVAGSHRPTEKPLSTTLAFFPARHYLPRKCAFKAAPGDFAIRRNDFHLASARDCGR